MKYTLRYNDIRFGSNSDEVEALRRALEIRAACKEQGRMAWHNSCTETYVWETPLANGLFEVETVTICEESQVVTYMRTEIAQAS